MKIEYRKTSLSELKKNCDLEHVLGEYAEESAIAELPGPSAQMGTYRTLEDMGAMEIIGAFDDRRLVGFVSVLLSPLPHYGVTAGVTESLFVLKEYRKRGVGLRLLRMAEDNARARGAHGLLASSPTGGVLEKVLSRMDSYRQTNSVFFRRLI